MPKVMTRWLLVIVTFANMHVYATPYLLNPGDIIRIDVWNEDAISREVLVRPDGVISLPMAGEIDTTGKTPAGIAESISIALSSFIKDVPQVVVSLVDVTGNTIFVIGKVARPGEYKITSDTDVMQALALAGGLNAFAAENDILILRRDGSGEQTAIPFPYAKVKNGKSLDSNIVLRSRDVVVVP
ncbi:MAG: polysaccharide biosynthesis/export family protein [Pseudomonadota bacterium]